MEWEDYFIHKDKVLFKDSSNRAVLKNNLNITDNKELEKNERLLTRQTIKQLINKPIKGKFDLLHFQKIHKAIFSKIYPPEIAGGLRQGTKTPTKIQSVLNGRSVEYSPPEFIEYDATLALKRLNAIDLKKEDEDSFINKVSKNITDVWVTHPFMEGNTRATAILLTQFCNEKGFNFDFEKLNEKSNFRDALVESWDGRPENLKSMILYAHAAVF